MPGENGSGWRDTGEELDSLRSSFRSSYRQGAGGGPSREQVTDAFEVLVGAITHMVAGAENTLKDPAVKKQVQKTTKTAATAVAATLSEWAAELRSRLEKRPGARRDAAAGEGSAEEGAGGGKHSPVGEEPLGS